MRTISFLIFSAYFLLLVIAVPLPRVLPCEAGEISTWITCDISLSTSPPTETPSSEELCPQLEKRGNQHQQKVDAARWAAKKPTSPQRGGTKPTLLHRLGMGDHEEVKPKKPNLLNRLDMGGNPPHQSRGGVGYAQPHHIPDLPDRIRPDNIQVLV